MGASGTLSRFGDLERIILKDGFKITRKIYSIIEGENLETMAKSTGLGIIELSSIFSDIKPNFVMVIADRFENMSIAIAAVTARIFHVFIRRVGRSQDQLMRVLGTQ